MYIHREKLLILRIFDWVFSFEGASTIMRVSYTKLRSETSIIRTNCCEQISITGLNVANLSFKQSISVFLLGARLRVRLAQIVNQKIFLIRRYFLNNESLKFR
jgi:hypothetical protein